jgi:hypothetical protein
MYYTLIDPPVTPFSRPEKISAWISELHSRRSRPEFQYPENRKRLNDAIQEAEQWLVESQSIHRSSPRDRPAV